MKIKLFSFFAALSLLLIGCQGSAPSKQTTGAVLGGAVGGIAGSQIGSGKGRDVAMVVGTLLGAALGGMIGNSMDTTDEVKLRQAVATGQSDSWTNQNTNAQYSVTPTRDFQTSSGQECREYKTVAVIEGEKQEMTGTACKQPDGSWVPVRL